MRLSGVLVCVFVSAVLAVGCGGGSSSGTGGASAGTSAETSTAGTETNGSGDGGGAGADGGSQSGPLTKKAFIKEAEAVCRKIPTTFEEKSAALAKSMKGQKPTSAETKLKAGVPTDRLAIEELEALSPPTGDEQKVEAIIQSLKSAAKGLEENPESEFSGPLSPFAEWQKLTKAYGLSFCSQL